MAEMAWEHAAEARAALNAIVTDPDHGVEALSSPRTMSNLLKDLLPDAPREKTLLIAAAEAGLADSLRQHVAQGMDASTAIRLTASSFSTRTPLTPDACGWATSEIAAALGISEAHDAAPVNQDHSPETAGHGSSRDSRLPAAAGPLSSAPGPTAVEAGSAAFPPGPTPYPPGPPGYPPGAAGYSPRPDQRGFGPGSGIGYPPVQVPGPMTGYQPGLAVGQGRRSNALAVTSLVLGLVQLVGWILFVLPGLVAAILAVVFGFVSMNQIKRTGERGRGMAVAGLVLGFLGIAIVGLLVVVGAAGSTST